MLQSMGPGIDPADIWQAILYRISGIRSWDTSVIDLDRIIPHVNNDSDVHVNAWVQEGED